MGFRYAFPALAAAILILAGPHAHAARQILAALPDTDGIKLTCSDGQCRTSISTLCLQKDRQIPLPGQVYRPAGAGQFTLRLTAADRGTLDVPAQDIVRFETERDFVSVRAVFDMARFAALDAIGARLVVAEDASLVPETEPADPNPLSAEEIAYVTTSVRQLAASQLHGRTDTASAQAFGRMVTALRETGNLKGEEGRRALESLWDATLKETPGGRITDDAANTLRFCTSGGDGYNLESIRRCLSYEHSRMLKDLNLEHWRNQPGS